MLRLYLDVFRLQFPRKDYRSCTGLSEAEDTRFLYFVLYFAESKISPKALNDGEKELGHSSNENRAIATD